VVYDTEVSDPLTAEKLIVVPDVISGVFNALNISVEDNATIFELTDGQQRLIEIGKVQDDDQVIAYGIDACDDDFYAFVLLVIR